MYWLSSDGVRKQDTITPFNGRGGYVPGTPSTIDGLPALVARSHRRGSRMAVLVAIVRLS